MRLLWVVLAAVLWAAPAQAAVDDAITNAHPVLEFDGYALGLPVAHVRVELDMNAAGYAVRMDYRVTGLLATFASGGQVATVTGHWRGDGAAPEIFRSDGEYFGSPRHTAIDFTGEQPRVQRLEPANDGRQPVPVFQTKEAVDPLTAMAVLLHNIQQHGRCDSRLLVFDGRRLGQMVAWDAGAAQLPASDRSSYAGPARLCDVQGSLLAGFKKDAGAAAHRPSEGAVWFASLPGMPTTVPVRLRVPTPWIGSVMLYLTGTN